VYRKIVLILLFVCVSISSAHASALTQGFRQAKKAEKSGDLKGALLLYQNLIEKYPNRVKSILRAYDHILNIHKNLGQEDKYHELLSEMKKVFPSKGFDVKDIEKLSVIYSKNGEEEEALRLQRYLVDTPHSSVYRKEIIRTYARLLKHYAAKEDKEQVSALVKKLEAMPEHGLDDKDIYKIALFHLKYGNKEKAITLLKNLVQRSPDAVLSRKALYVLAMESYTRKDYEGAIAYYSRYIERYPENTFYVQKAYQRIVDSYLAMGKVDLSNEMMKKVTDEINGLSDYRSQLNLAIDLKFKGMDELAEVTFKKGYMAATKIIEEKPGKYDAVKAYLEILRAAHALAKSDIAEKSASAIISGFDSLGKDKKYTENVAFIQSQAYLWLGRIYKEREDHEKTIKVLEDFLHLYPASKDREYAVFELANEYESKGDRDKAKGLYEIIQTEPFKNRAEQRLAILK